MARSPTTLDPFNALAEAKRRQILEKLAGREMTVNKLVLELGWPQPVVSKHLGVLRQVGLVSAERRSREQVYRMNAGPLKPLHDWLGTFERFWTDHLHDIKQRAEAMARSAETKPPSDQEPI